MAATIGPNARSPLSQQRPASWIPWVFVGLFCIVLAVNGTMITIAISTFNGLETTSAYEKGLAYNDRLAAAAEQEKLGWEASLQVASADTDRVVLTFVVSDKSGAPVIAADVHARLDRPLQAGHDQTVDLEEIGSGRYAATVALPFQGQWNVHLTADARGYRYQLTKRIQVSR